MITAVDSSVLLAVFNREPGAEHWLESLVEARRNGRLIVCEIVFAEIAPWFSSRDVLERRLESMGVAVSPIDNATAWEAGRVFLQYRRGGGPREHLIPDFLIAAHARIQANRLAAIDRGHLRRWFSDLQLLTPD